jgi:hypothetical protein
VPAPRGHDRKAGGARPVDQFAYQRRLIAVAEAVHHACSLRLAREQRPAEGIGLDRDVDHMLAMGEGCQAMFDCGRRIAGAFDDDVDLWM